MRAFIFMVGKSSAVSFLVDFRRIVRARARLYVALSASQFLQKKKTHGGSRTREIGFSTTTVVVTRPPETPACVCPTFVPSTFTEL